MSDVIVAGTDGSPQAAKALNWAAAVAKRLGAELLVVHVFETDPATLPGGYAILPEDELKRLRDGIQQKLQNEWCAAARAASVRYRSIMVDGNVAGALMNLAEGEKAILIVVGSRGRGGFAELLLGSVGHHLVQHSRIPVTIVPDR